MLSFHPAIGIAFLDPLLAFLFRHNHDGAHLGAGGFVVLEDFELHAANFTPSLELAEDLFYIVDIVNPMFLGNVPTPNNGTSVLPCGDPLPEITSIQAVDVCSEVGMSFSETFEGDNFEGFFGVLTWVVEAFDCAGNSTQYTTNFIVNDPAPVIQIEQLVKH